MATNLNITDLDFDDIKDNLKSYLKQQTIFNDYDFDGAGMNVLLDVLAYNTHYNAMAAHLSLNEAFLDSAQIRGNAVSRARMLGYVPTSELAPRAKVNVVLDVATEVAAGQDVPSTITIPRGAKFQTSVQGITYRFVTLDAHTATINNNKFTYNDVEIAEGSYNSIKYRVDNDIQIQKHQIPHKNVDTTSMRVRVQANEESTSYDLYTKFESLLNVDNTTQIYHVQENSNGFYEVYFGDTVIGKKPAYNNIVTIDYVYTHGKDANGASTFSMSDSIGGFNNITVTKVSNAAGGAEQETIESVRYNAPIAFTSQNRAVTAEDYRSIIKKNFTNIASINTWGGEDQAIPDYGRIYICIKPNTADTLTTAEKTSITNSILKGKNVVSITPEVVDPNYSFLELDVSFKYNANLTDRTATDLKTLVTDTIVDFSVNELNSFDGLFRHSQLLRTIDSSDPAIISSTVRPYLFQNYTPTANVLNNVTLTFPGIIYTPSGASESCIESTGWEDGNGVTNYFNDKAIEGSTDRQVFAYKLVGDVKVTTIDNCGTVSPSTGSVTLNNFTPANNTAIRITVIPNSLDIAPKRDQILSIEATRLTVTPEEDTIATAGSSGSVGYTTTPRFRD